MTGVHKILGENERQSLSFPIFTSRKRLRENEILERVHTALSRGGTVIHFICFYDFFPALFSIFKKVTPTEMLIEYYCEYCILFT